MHGVVLVGFDRAVYPVCYQDHVRKGRKAGMADIEKVIKGLEHCTSYGSTCDKCDYWEHNRNEDDPHCGDVLMRDALELLKEQQVEIKRLKGEGKPPTWKKGKAFCGNCGGCLENKEMFSSYPVQSIRFCKWCGTPVNWVNG